jgi:catechol 2,3-dioxygenase-like lactoylglutathione lyase family enzyme
MQLTLPPGREADARQFYAGLLGLTEIPKPPELAQRGGVWFQLGSIQLHFGVEEAGVSSRRHIAIQVEDAEVMCQALRGAGYAIEDAISVDGIRRFYCRDPFGNRTEFLEVRSPTGEV